MADQEARLSQSTAAPAEHLVSPSGPDATSTQAGSTRNVSVDALKGFLIVAVVLGHAPYNTYFAGAEQTWQVLLISGIIGSLSIYYFHMPLFLAVGVFFQRPYSLDEARKSAIAILLPYVAWHAVLSGPKAPWDSIAGITHVIVAIPMGNFTYLQSTLWFLPALFSLKILDGLLLWFLNTVETRWRLACVVALLVIWSVYFSFSPALARWHSMGIIPFGIDIGIYLLPFAALMRIIYRRRADLAHAWALSAALLVLGRFLISKFEPVKTISNYPAVIDVAQYSMPWTIAGLAGMAAMSAGILIFFLKLNISSAPARLLAFLGRYTFAIFILHMAILHAVEKIGARVLDRIPANGSGIVALVWCLLAIILAVALPVVVSRIAIRISSRFRYAGFSA